MKCATAVRHAINVAGGEAAAAREVQGLRWSQDHKIVFMHSASLVLTQSIQATFLRICLERDGFVARIWSTVGSRVHRQYPSYKEEAFKGS